MERINNIKIKSLKQTRAFYIWELKRSESLTPKQKEAYSLALKSIEKIIKEKEKSGEKAKNKKNKNPFLKSNGGIDLIEEFPSIDYLKYSIERNGKIRGDKL